MTTVKREDLVKAIGFDPIASKQRREDYEAGVAAERDALLPLLREALEFTERGYRPGTDWQLAVKRVLAERT